MISIKIIVIVLLIMVLVLLCYWQESPEMDLNDSIRKLDAKIDMLIKIKDN